MAALQARIATRGLQEPTEAYSTHQLSDFSLVLGGPLFQLFRRAYLTGDGLELLYRRIIAVTLIAWLPLLILSAPDHSASRLSLFRDVAVHVRFLIALPVLIAAELIVHLRIRPVVRRFVDRSIVVPEELSRFDEAIDSTIKPRNSTVLEVGLLILVYSLGLSVWQFRVHPETSTWYHNTGGRWNLTPAGFWYVFVSIPVFQFVLLRWYARLFIWFRFLWMVSRLNLHLVPTHPDRCAGLAFVGKSAYAYSPILFAQGAMLAGVIASRVLYGGESLLSFELQIAGFIAFFVVVVLGPLLMFTSKLAAAKRKGLADYGLVAQHYVDGFERKSVLGEHDPAEELLGSGDIQSLADLGNSYAMVREMRPVPCGLDDISRLAAATAAPLLPLLRTIFSPEELLLRIVKVVF